MKRTKNFIFFIFLQLHSLNSIEINKNHVGVKFNPYVKNGDGLLSVPDKSQYSFDELKTMLELVSTKFSRVMTDTVDAFDVQYKPGVVPYHENAYIIARTAEGASVINRERNKTDLIILIGIRRYDDEFGGEKRTAKEIDVAIEAAEIAHSIYPGTVEGFQLSDVRSDQTSEQLGLKWVDYLRNKTNDRGFKIGVSIHLDDLTEINMNKMNKSFDKHLEPISNLISKSDFVTCKFEVNEDLPLNKGKENFSVQATMLRYQMKPNASFYGLTGLASAGNKSFQTIENLQNYWTEINRFAYENPFFVWLDEAFDVPLYSEKDSAHKGWWRLIKNELSNNVSGYVEKILEHERNHMNSTSQARLDTWTWVNIVVSVGTLIIVTLFGTLIYLYKKMTTLQQVLTKDEVLEFKFGTSDKYMEADHEIVCGTAMKRPYNQNLEISEDSLEICWTQILGRGEFGCVFKALWKCSPSKEVALKTTKADCRTSALRGILSEIKILTHLGQHPNIVSICGAYTAELAKGKVYLAIELCPMGSLKKYFDRITTDSRHRNIYENIMTNHDILMRWSFEIVSGMEHLEKMGVVHADLATRNVLLSSAATAKISDFGLSRRLYDYANYVKQHQEPLPWRWMAIESLKMMLFSHKSDVWSYGVTLWEIFSLGGQPYPGLSWRVDFVDCLENGLRMTKPRLATSKLYELMLDCWHSEPDRRPTFVALKNGILDICNEHIYGNVEVKYYDIVY